MPGTCDRFEADGIGVYDTRSPADGYIGSGADAARVMNGLHKRAEAAEATVKARTITDGHGNEWEKCRRPDCDLHVVRPGKVQCEGCSGEGPVELLVPDTGDTRDEQRAAALAAVNRIFDQMDGADLEWRGTLLAVAYSGTVETRYGTHHGDGVAHAIIGHPAGNLVLLGAAHTLCSEVERRIETFNRNDGVGR